MDIATALARALAENGLVPPLTSTDLARPEDVAALAAAARAAVPWRIEGWKIGATSEKARAMLRTEQPFFGPIFQPRVFADGATLPLPPRFLGFECELALRLGAALPAKAGGYNPAALAIAIDAVVLVIELVATRQDMATMDDARRAAVDFGFNHGVVLGPTLAPPPLDGLDDVTVVATVDDVEVGRGSSRDVLGHPLRALAWLTQQGIDVAAGQIVSTGTCTGIARVEPGQRACARFVRGDAVWGEVSFVAA